MVVLGYTWYFLIWEGAEPGPKPRKIEIFNWFSWVSQANTISMCDMNWVSCENLSQIDEV